jgi:hypothetical protein
LIPFLFVFRQRGARNHAKPGACLVARFGLALYVQEAAPPKDKKNDARA